MEVAMQKSRRSFLKKSAVVAGAAAVGTSAMAMSNKSEGNAGSNGVVVGQSPKKEITYKKTAAWEEYYKQAL
jgi:nitrous oxide reductase